MSATSTSAEVVPAVPDWGGVATPMKYITLAQERSYICVKFPMLRQSVLFPHQKNGTEAGIRNLILALLGRKDQVW